MLTISHISGSTFKNLCFSCDKYKLGAFYMFSNENMSLAPMLCSDCYFSIWLDCIGLTEHKLQLDINFVLLPRHNSFVKRCDLCNEPKGLLNMLMNPNNPVNLRPRYCNECLEHNVMMIIKKLPSYYKNREVLRLFTAKYCKDINIDHMLSSEEQSMLAKGRDELCQHLPLPDDIKNIIAFYF